MLEDIKRTIEAATKDLTAERAQKIARNLLEPGARKDQVTKLAQDLMDRSRRNRDRVRAFIVKEVKSQLKGMGLATRAEVDALSRRVRSLEKGGPQTRGTGAAARSKTAASRSKASTRGSTPKPASGRRSTSTGGGARSAGGGGRRGANATG